LSVSVRVEIPSSQVSISQKRFGPSVSERKISMVHVSESIFATFVMGQSSFDMIEI
jgi:hypothetical protein